MKKIVCVICGLAGSGGAERVMSLLCNSFCAMGIKVELIVQEPEISFYPLDPRVIIHDTGVQCPIPLIRPAIREMKLRKLLKESEADVILSFITQMNNLTLLAGLGLKKPIYVSERINPRLYQGTMTDKIRSILYKKASGVICQTKEAADYFTGTIRSKCSVIPNLLMDEIPNKVDYSKTFKMVAVGRLEDQKNYPLMFMAFAEFKKAHPDYSLTIYGKGSKREHLLQLIDTLNMRDSIILAGVSDNVLEEVASCDIYLLTSNYEGMPNALAEALAMGMPCISTDCDGGGAAFLIDHGNMGILTPCNDVRALVNAMASLADSEELRREYGENAQIIRKKLSTKKVAEEWISVMMLKEGGR